MGHAGVWPLERGPQFLSWLCNHRQDNWPLLASVSLTCKLVVLFSTEEGGKDETSRVPRTQSTG